MVSGQTEGNGTTMGGLLKNHGGFAYYRPGNAIFPGGLRKPPGHAHYQGGLHNSKIQWFMPGLILISG